MRLHRVLLALLCCGCGGPASSSLLSKPPSATLDSFPIQGTLLLNGASTAEINLLGQTNVFSLFSATEDWQFPVFTCASACNLTVDVPTAAIFESPMAAYENGMRGATVDGITSDIVLGDLYIQFPVSAGEATDTVPVTITGTLVGYDLGMPCQTNCELSAPLWKLTITGSGTMNAFQVVPGVWDSASTVFTGTATSEPLD